MRPANSAAADFCEVGHTSWKLYEMNDEHYQERPDETDDKHRARVHDWTSLSRGYRSTNHAAARRARSRCSMTTHATAGQVQDDKQYEQADDRNHHVSSPGVGSRPCRSGRLYSLDAARTGSCPTAYRPTAPSLRATRA